jgi:hypothetical protein
VLAELLPRYLERQLYGAILEAIASEQSARMVAMRNATDNANELIKDLTLVYNKARQEHYQRVAGHHGRSRSIERKCSASSCRPSGLPGTSKDLQPRRRQREEVNYG